MKLSATLSIVAAVFVLAACAPTLCAAAPSTVWAAQESDHPRPGFGRAEDLAEQCFWWNATAAAVQFYRPACVDYALSIAWWAPAWVAALLFLAAFPVVFLVARYKCNCCGGRYPSFSCCFPSDDEPHWFGRYSTPSVGCHVAVLLLCLAPVIGCGVMSITNNAVLHDKLDTVLQPLPAPDVYLGQLRTFAATAATMAQQEEFDLGTIVPPSVATTLQVVTHYAKSRLQEASSGLSTAETVEYYRVRAHYGVLGATLAVALVTGTVSLLRRGVVLPVMQLLLAWCGAAVVVSVGVTGGLKVTRDAACDAWGPSTVDIAAGAADGSPLCNRADIRSAVSSIEAGVHNAFTDSQNSLCTALSTVCTPSSASSAFTCPALPAFGLCGSDGAQRRVTTKLMAATVDFDATALQQFMQASTNAAGASMWECGAGDESRPCAHQYIVTRLFRFSQMSTRLVLAAYNVSQSDSKCQWVSEYLNNNVHDRICNHDLNDDLTWTTIWSGLVAVFAGLALYPVIRGIKRFRKPSDGSGDEDNTTAVGVQCSAVPVVPSGLPGPTAEAPATQNDEVPPWTAQHSSDEATSSASGTVDRSFFDAATPARSHTSLPVPAQEVSYHDEVISLHDPDYDSVPMVTELEVSRSNGVVALSSAVDAATHSTAPDATVPGVAAMNPSPPPTFNAPVLVSAAQVTPNRATPQQLALMAGLQEQIARTEEQLRRRALDRAAVGRATFTAEHCASIAELTAEFAGTDGRRHQTGQHPQPQPPHRSEPPVAVSAADAAQCAVAVAAPQELVHDAATQPPDPPSASSVGRYNDDSTDDSDDLAPSPDHDSFAMDSAAGEQSSADDRKAMGEDGCDQRTVSAGTASVAGAGLDNGMDQPELTESSHTVYSLAPT